MKTMYLPPNIIDRTVASIFGLCGGVTSYLEIHLGFDSSFWGSFLDRSLSILGALIIAFLSGAAGYLGSIFVKWFVKKFIRTNKIDAD